MFLEHFAKANFDPEFFARHETRNCGSIQQGKQHQYSFKEEALETSF